MNVLLEISGIQNRNRFPMKLGTTTKTNKQFNN